MRTSVHAALVGAVLTFIISLSVRAQKAVRPAVETELAPKTQTVRVGDPVTVSLHVRNPADQETTVERSMTAFDCFEVVGPDGKSPPYVGFIGQIMAQPLRLSPAQTAVIADELDLTDKYLFDKVGAYSIQFRGMGRGVTASNRITVDLTRGQLSELDQIVTQLLPIRPDGWGLTKSGRNQKTVRPSGRAEVPGYGVHICGDYMRGEAVYIWLTKAAAALEPGPDDARGMSEPIGRTRGMRVYITVADKTRELWPTAIDDISRALKIERDGAEQPPERDK